MEIISEINQYLDIFEESRAILLSRIASLRAQISNIKEIISTRGIKFQQSAQRAFAELNRERLVSEEEALLENRSIILRTPEFRNSILNSLLDELL